ncbi:uncharacterized protein LOC110459953 [Mizuhopecten yessoensis]|uniref:uncharacterized protein LOC110459953 n=1 Tax=Mizuhopecten yessoensis TaxID=6573 RepID=UPI000B45903A|nr:uncharacterized protein LOC110459953 [Mizuhopecten yessoensis]
MAVVSMKRTPVPQEHIAYISQSESTAHYHSSSQSEGLTQTHSTSHSESVPSHIVREYGLHSTFQSEIPGHRLVTRPGRQLKACVYCQLKKVKTRSGWVVKSYYMCEACGVPLCRGQRECYHHYHQLISGQGQM